MNQLVIANTDIKQDAEGRYCLNDLHKAAGGESRHQPGKWLSNKQTVELVREYDKTGFPVIETKQGLGTFASKELVCDYAMWISAAFKVQVISVFNSAQINPMAVLNDPAAMRGLLLTYTEKVLQLEAVNAELQPKADFFDAVTGSATAVDMAVVAKTLNMGLGRNQLFEFLRNKAILDRKSMPYQVYCDRGYFRVVESSFQKPDGSTHVSFKTVVFQKGMQFIRKMINEMQQGELI